MEERNYTFLSSGHKIPLIGLGTGGITKFDTFTESVKTAILMGYRYIDTASIYNTEEMIGEVITQLIKEGKVKREDLFITTKFWNHEKSNIEKAL